MPFTFVDASYLIGLFNKNDELHSRARSAGLLLERDPRSRLVTTDLVISEFLAACSRLGRQTRVQAVDFVDAMLDDPTVQMTPVTDALFRRGLDFYRARPDKRYSLVDCVSMLICQDLRITQVLTSDRDFAHEGLVVLLR